MFEISHSKDFGLISRKADFFLNLAFTLFSLICIMPFVLLVSISLTPVELIKSEGYRFIPTSITIDAYKFVLHDVAVVGRAYWVTILSTVVGTAINVTAMSLFAYPLSRPDFRYKKFFNVFIIITLLFSGGLTPTYYVNVNLLHLKNTFWALVLPSLGGGFNIYIMRTYFKQNIPISIIESAKMDGAGEFRAFFQLVLPLSLPVLAAMSLFNVFAFWNNWINSMYYIDRPNWHTLQYVMQQAIMNLQYMKQAFSGNTELMSRFGQNLPTESVRMAMVVVGVGPIIFVYPFFQKYFIRGLTVGAIKG